MFRNRIRIFKEKRIIKTVVSIAIMVMLTFVVLPMLFGCNNSVEKYSEKKVKAVLEGGSGKARIEDAVIFNNNGQLNAKIRWSSANYDYMIVDGEKYYPVNTEGNSVFEIPLSSEESVEVIADTTAMGTPHEIEYKIIFTETEEELATEEDVDENSNKSKDNDNEKHNLSDAINTWTNNHTVTWKAEREYATKFSITEYDDKYNILKIEDDGYYLLLKDSVERPIDFPDGVSVINIPVDSAYIVSTSAVNFYSSLDALNSIKYISMKNSDINDDEVKAAVDAGKILYAGKYSAPDYELLLANGCNLIVENTMIYHKPDILEKLKKLGFCVMTEYSNQEEHPVGRMEWIKLFGFLTGNYEKAEEIFNEKKSIMENNYEKTNKKIAYFYINSAGAVVTRKNNDYIPKLIETAGGEYALMNISQYDGSGTMNVQAESFFKDVLESDYFIYNSSINGEIENIDELVYKCPVLRNSKAVKTGNVYCTEADFYKSVMSFPEIVEDINQMMNGQEELEFLKKLK